MGNGGEKISVMIVDDSSVYRTLLRDVLAKDDEIEVVAQAVNGRLALPRIRHYRPNVLVLDNEMPEMTGLETLEAMKNEFPDVAVIMFSSHTVQGAKVTIKALELGALDFVTKPDPTLPDPGGFISQNLIPRIKSIIHRRRKKAEIASGAIPAPVAPPPPKPARTLLATSRFEACTIGISTGGPAALRTLLPLIKGNMIRGPILIVQHMPPLFTRQLAESLSAISTLTVVEGEDGMALEKGKVYIAPGGKHMVVDASSGAPRVKITDEPPELNCKPSVNILFRSVAQYYGNKSMGIIMTGMGDDGFEGMKLMKQSGSYLMAQSEASCLVFGMPSKPTRENLVDEIHDINGIAIRIQELMAI